MRRKHFGKKPFPEETFYAMHFFAPILMFYESLFLGKGLGGVLSGYLGVLFGTRAMFQIFSVGVGRFSGGVYSRFSRGVVRFSGEICRFLEGDYKIFWRSW